MTFFMEISNIWGFKSNISQYQCHILSGCINAVSNIIKIKFSILEEWISNEWIEYMFKMETDSKWIFSIRIAKIQLN